MGSESIMITVAASSVLVAVAYLVCRRLARGLPPTEDELRRRRLDDEHGYQRPYSIQRRGR